MVDGPSTGEGLTASRGPWTGGYTSSVPAFMARPDQITGNPDGTSVNSESSRDCVIDPATGGLAKRMGCAIQGDTLAVRLEVSGILTGKWGAKSRKVFGLDSPSMTSGMACPAILYGEDTNTGFPATDSGFPGVVYAKSNNGGLSTAQANYSLLKEMNTTTYQDGVSGVAGEPVYNSDSFFGKVVPIWMESGDGVYNRGCLTGVGGADRFMQQFLTCGSRSLLQTQNWLYAPNLRCTPWRWNKHLNETTADEVVRIFPTGPLPPLRPPRYYSAGLTVGANNSTWVDGDTFYVSIIFQFEDGSYSAPFIPRPAQVAPAPLTSGLGLVTVGTIGGTNKYPFVPYRSVPLGPEGTVARILLRTTKQNRVAVTDTVTVAPLDLRIFGVLRNNTQTSYNDYNGDDDSLFEDQDIVRVDNTMPRRARYIGTGDQRAIIGYTLPNTAAILLAPITANQPGNNNDDYNVVDTSSIPYSNPASLVRITSTQFEIHRNSVANPKFSGGSENAVAFLFSTYPTIGELVDAINNTAYNGFAGQWAAQLAPGVDDTLSSASLTLTTFDIAVTGTLSVTLTGTASDVAKVGILMKVSGTNITAGTYVVAKPSSTTITISTATVGAPGATTTFYQETGDNSIVTGGTLGYMRAFMPAFSLLLHMKPSVFPKYDAPDKTSIYYTNASPGAAASGSSLAPNSWLSGNKNVPHSSPRQTMQRCLQGIVDFEGGGLVAYNDGIFVFKNVRGANTGEDFDCRLFTVNDGRGCVSHLGLIAGNGWAAYPTTEGIICTDKNLREFRLSGAVFNPSDNTGDLASIIATSAASAAADTDSQWLSMAVMGSKIFVGFNPSGSPPSHLSYDFSPGIEASGVEELLNPETKEPYIWSPPAMFNTLAALGVAGAMGSVTGSSGREDYITFCDNNGTLDGRLERINTGTQDNGDNISAYGTMAVVVPSPFKALSPQNMEVVHKTLTTSAAASIVMANDQVPTWVTSLARTLPVNAAKTLFQKQIVPIDQKQRGKLCEVLWVQWRTSAISTTTDRIWSMVLRYDEFSTENPTGA